MIGLKKARKEKKLSVVKFSQEMEVSPSAVYNWEKGYRTPSAFNMKKASIILKRTVDELFFEN